MFLFCFVLFCFVLFCYTPAFNQLMRRARRLAAADVRLAQCKAVGWLETPTSLLLLLAVLTRQQVGC